MPYPDRLDTGLLGVYVTTARGWMQLTRVTAAAAIGAAEDHPLVAYLTAPCITITLGRHAYVPTTLDGELVRLGGPLKVEIVAGGLKVLAPKAKPADTAKD
jgi:diacylglycerol kinase family enzyme